MSAKAAAAPPRGKKEYRASLPGPEGEGPRVEPKIGRSMAAILKGALDAYPKSYRVTNFGKSGHGTRFARRLAERGLVELVGFDQPDTFGERFVRVPPAVKEAIDMGDLIVPALSRLGAKGRARRSKGAAPVAA